MITILTATALIFLILTYLARRLHLEGDFFVVRLVRHGESTENAGLEDYREVGDHNIRLTDTGWQQARNRGKAIGRKRLANAIVYSSPYRRTRETRRGILEGAGFSQAEIEAFRRFEDPLIREVEFGYGDLEAQIEKRGIHSYFYYRFEGGESPAEAYDRITGFIEILWRQVKREFRWEFVRRLFRRRPKEVFVVGHGLAHRLFVMRWLHLTVEEFNLIANPHNCDEITIAPVKWLKNPQFVCGRWGVEGLRWRTED